MMITEPTFDIPKITDVESVRIRRCSTGKIMMPNVGTAVISRYRRNPQASCHDICKYGATDSLSPRNSISKALKPKQVAARQTLTGKVSNFGVGRKKWLVIKSTISWDSKTRKPDIHVLAKIAQPQVGLHEENVGTNSSDEKKLETDVSLKPVASDCIRREAWSWTDKELVSSKRMSSPPKGTNIAIEYAGFSKMRPQLKPPLLLKPACSSGKPNIGGSKSKDTDAMVMPPMEVSSGRNKGNMTDGKERNSMVCEKRNLLPSSSLNKAKTKNSRGVCHSNKKQNSKKIKAEKSFGKNAKGSKYLKKVSHLTDEKNVTKPYSSDIPEKTLFTIESNPENKPAEADQTSASAGNQPKMPYSSSKDETMKHTPEKDHTGESLRSFKDTKTNASSKSTHNNATTDHNEVATEKQTSSFKMMKTTSKDIYLQGEKLNFQRGKVIELPLEDCTPRRLEFKQRLLIDSKNGIGEEITPRKLSFSDGRQQPDGDQHNAIEDQSKLISLRHNNVKEKKNSGSLYNNMIEETAIKLVNTKRSKVKALVSAFESVISLLDTASFTETK